MIENALHVVRAAAEPAPKKTPLIVSNDRYLVFGVPDQVKEVQRLLVDAYEGQGRRREESEFSHLAVTGNTAWWYCREHAQRGKVFDGHAARTYGQPQVGKVVYVPGKPHMLDARTAGFERLSALPGAVVFDGYVRLSIDGGGSFNRTLELLLQKTSTYTPALAHYSLQYSYNKGDMFVYLPVLSGNPKVTEKHLPDLAQKAQSTIAKLVQAANAFVDLAHGFSEQVGRQAFKISEE